MTQRPPHSTAPGRSPSRTVVAPPAPRLAGDRANASQADLLGLTVSVSVAPSQHLIIEVLRRPVEFTEFNTFAMMADGYPDPVTGECTMISAAQNIGGIPAFLVPPPDETLAAIRTGSTTASR